MTTFSMKIKVFLGQPSKIEGKWKKIKKWRQDSSQEANHGQRSPKVRSKSVPEAHMKAQKAYGTHWRSGNESNIWGPGAI